LGGALEDGQRPGAGGGPTGPLPIALTGGFEPIIGPDLLSLIRERPEQLISLTEISTLPSPVRRRAAFRLEFAGGLTLKGRRLESPERAQRLHHILGRDGFPRAVDRRGDALLIQWVEGRVLTALDRIPPAVLERCGRILGALHRLERPDWLDVREPAPADWLAKLQMATGLLSAAGELDAGLGRAAVESAAARVPGQVSAGIIHKDFCAENIVLDASGAPVSIDNGTVSFGPLDLDLARTWYRWPMTPADREHLLRGYAEYRSHASFMEHFSFWAIAVLVASASSRLRLRVGRHREPLERLRTLLDSLDRHDLDPLRWAV
jgi:hypothetical protein